MSVIKMDEIMAYQIKEETVCTDCATKDETDDLTLDDVILESSRDDEEFTFCDRCKKQI